MHQPSMHPLHVERRGEVGTGMTIRVQCAEAWDWVRVAVGARNGSTLLIMSRRRRPVR